MGERGGSFRRQVYFWTGTLLLCVLLLWLFSSILLPFVLGMVIAYLLDPVADWFERRGFSRLMATIIILFLFISIFVAIDAQTGRVIVGPEIQARGFAEDETVFDDVRPQIVKALTEASDNGMRDAHGYSQVVRRTVGRWVNTQHRRRPMIVPVVIEA